MDFSDLVKSPRAALLVVDQQVDFEPGGALPVPGGDELVQPIANLMTRFKNVILTQDSHPAGHISFASSHEGKHPFDILRLSEVESGDVKSKFEKEVVIDYLKRVPAKVQVLWPDHCVVNTPGWQFDAGIPVERAAFVLQKGTRATCDSYSAFFENDGTSTNLADRLRAMEVETIVIAGLAGDYCVYWTAADAIKEGFKVVYDETLTRFVNFPEGSKENALLHLKEIGVQICQVSSKLCLFDRAI
jgi:nicotinamidase/pyrazinamidase